MTWASDSGANGCAQHLAAALAQAMQGEHPYRHWLMRDVLPDTTCAGLIALPLRVPEIGNTQGRRETHNESHIFINSESRARFPVCAQFAEALRASETIRRIESLCAVNLAGSSLRIEYCLDTGGFWLEPHTDIGAKLFTFLIYLSDHPDAPNWGTDILDTGHRLVLRVAADFNRGLIFVPGTDTWHAFGPRPIAGVRRTLIVNYVVPEWRSRHELAFPEQPIEA